MSWRLNLAPLATCRRAKRRHHSRAEAEGQREFMAAVGIDQPERGRLASYRCPTCRAWHLGHRRA